MYGWGLLYGRLEFWFLVGILLKFMEILINLFKKKWCVEGENYFDNGRFLYK